jgi:nicotinamide-nucleotide amidase
MGVRAGIIVTGTEVLTGRVSDRNGPWLAEQLRQLGVDVGQIVVVGDRPDDLLAALAFLGHGNDLVITSGGLGPTADDLTAAIVAQAQGRPVRFDADLEQRIAAIVERLSARLGGTRSAEATASGTRKQAMVPEGATVLEPAGTAPGLVVAVAEGRIGPPVIVLPGPPWELQQMWPAAVAAPDVAALLAGVPELRQHTLRLWGLPESELAATLRRVEPDLTGLEITTCLAAGELEVVTRYAPDAQDALQRLTDAVRTDFPTQLFSDDGSTVDEQIAAALIARGWHLAVAESATGGALSARLSGRDGSGAYLSGGLAVTTDDALTSIAAVPWDTIAAAGPVSPAVAHAMADGARTRFGADVGIGVSGIDAGSGARPGTRTTSVHLCVITPDGQRARSFTTSAAPATLRQLVAPAALHLLRQLLSPLPAAGSSTGRT